MSTTSVKSTAGAWVDGIDIFENEKNPERDHANFPRRKVQELPDPVRHWWVPEEYFQFFHSKTGKSAISTRNRLFCAVAFSSLGL